MTPLELAVAGVLLVHSSALMSTTPNALNGLEPSRVVVEMTEIPKIPHETLKPTTYCSCIKTARLQGARIPYGTNASELVPNAPPTVGGLVLMKYPKSYHVAYIKELRDNGIVIVEGNYPTCTKRERVIPYSYKAIRGFWYN